MDDLIEIVLVADDQTPRHLRQHAGKKIPFYHRGLPQPLLPAPGTRGTMMGVPGEMGHSIGPGQLAWLIREAEPPPPERPPAWAAALDAKLDRILDVLLPAERSTDG